MMRWESRMIESVRRHILAWGCAAAVLLGLFIRYYMVPLVVADNEYFYSVWYELARTQGLAGLAKECDYSPLYQYLLVLFSACWADARGVKLLAIALECSMIAAACLLVRQVASKERKGFYTFVTLVLLCLNPLTLLNASGWGQTDTGYVAFSLFSLWFLLRQKPAGAFAFLGLALAFKLQAILLLPLYVIYYFCERKFSVLWFLLVPGIWIASGVPMALAGQSPLYAVQCYFTQTGLYSLPTFNCPNVYALLDGAMSSKQMIQGIWSRYGMALTVGALGGMLVYLVRRNAKFTDRLLLLLGAWCVLACIFFLPRMHERYGLAGEVLLLCWAVAEGKPRGFAYVLLGLLPTLSAYCKYMFRYPIFPLQWGAAMNLVLLGLLTYEVVRTVQARREPPERQRKVLA